MVEEVFEIAITYQYDASLEVPRAWTRRDLDDLARDEIYEKYVLFLIMQGLESSLRTVASVPVLSIELYCDVIIFYSMFK